MNHPDEDPTIDALRALWQRESKGIAQPSEDAPEESLATADSETQRTVAWLRNAWSEEVRQRVETPLPHWIQPRTGAPNPIEHERSKAGTVRRRFAYTGLTLAAAASMALMLTKPGVESEHVETPTVTANAEPTAPPSGGAESSRPLPTAFDAAAFTPRSNGIEVVTGSVRVVLLQAQSTTTTSTQR